MPEVKVYVLAPQATTKAFFNEQSSFYEPMANSPTMDDATTTVANGGKSLEPTPTTHTEPNESPKSTIKAKNKSRRTLKRKTKFNCNTNAAKKKFLLLVKMCLGFRLKKRV